MRVSYLTVRLSAKIIFRRCSGSLGLEQASKIDKLMHKHNEQQLQAAREEECRSSSSSSSSSNRPEQNEEDCLQVAKLAAGLLDRWAGAGHLLVPGEKAVPSAALLDLARKELGRVTLNGITTCDGTGATGLGLFPSGAMINHSCSPNCQAWWRGSQLEIRCSKPVAAGEELCLSYIPIDQPSTLRRAQLRHSWFFACRCRRCVSRQWDAELVGLRCPTKGCAGAVPPPPWCSGHACSHCGTCRAFDEPSTRPAPPDEGRKESRGASVVAMDSPSCCGRRKTSRTPPGDGENLDVEKGMAWSTCATREAQEMIVLPEPDYRGCEERLLGAARDFRKGMEAYMQEEPDVALVALEKSLLVRESLLHPFNKELLRTLRYASYAAIATQSWSKAYSFLSRWLRPMDVMYGAAEVWDIAAMRVDAGLVLDKLSEVTCGPGTVPPQVGEALPGLNKLSGQPETVGSMDPAAFGEMAAGLRWIWVCLGRDSGLSAEIAALESFADHGVTFYANGDNGLS
ncbi:unnamed protein product [Ectocarpus sp. 12 AP-2014]